MSCTDAGRLKVYLQSLSREDRYILLMSLADGLTPAEVSMVLDLPERTVRTRLAVLHREAKCVIRVRVDDPVAAAVLNTSLHAATLSLPA